MENYLSSYAFIELRILGQGFHNHLEKDLSEVETKGCAQCKNLNFKLCVLWQPMEPNILEPLKTFKTCYFYERVPKALLF